MSEIFESKFHKNYVGGVGEIVEPIKPSRVETRNQVRPTTYEEVLLEYRRYIGDMDAELPENIKKIFLDIQRTENDRST